MPDVWDQFPDAPNASAMPQQVAPNAVSDPWAQFPDAQQVTQQPAQQTSTQQTQQPNTWGQAVKNVAQAGAQFGTGMIGGLAGDIAGLGALGYDITANAIMHPLSGSTPSQYADPAAVRERVANALTYRAENPDSASSRIVQAPGQIMSGAGEFLRSGADKLDPSGTLGHFAAAAPLAVASGLGMKAGMPVRSAQGVALDTFKPLPKPVSPDQELIQRATDAGLRISPTAANKSVAGVVERTVGRAESERLISKKNVPVIDNLAKKQLGVPEGEELTQATFDRLRAQHNKPYEALSKLGKRKTSDAYREEINAIADRTGANSFAVDTPKAVQELRDTYLNIKKFDAKDAVAQVKKLRADARKALKSDDPDVIAMGYARRKIADALDNELERQAQESGKGGLAKAYRDARVKLAQLNSYEDAFEGNHISARELSRQLDRDVPLSGNARLIAEFSRRFDRSAQSLEKIRSVGPISSADYLVAALGTAGGNFINPGLAAAILARPAARSFLSSKLYQDRFIRPAAGATPGPVVAPSQAPAVVAPAVEQREPARRAR